MFRHDISGARALDCSFCHKSQDQVRTLIATPSSDAYICDECVSVCSAILDDDRSGPADMFVDAEFAGAIQRWLAAPPDDRATLAELRRRAEGIFGKAG